MPSPSSLRRDADFRRLWAGQALSQLGEHTGQLLLPLLAVTALHASAPQLGLLRAAGQLPVLLLSLFAGAWADRRRTRDVLWRADLGRALLLGALAGAAACGGLRLPVLPAAVFGVGVLSCLFDVGYQTALVRLVTPAQRLRATALLESTRSAAQLCGPALGGLLATSVPGAAGIALGALTFAGSACALRRIHRAETLPPVTSGRGCLGGIREGLAFVLRDPVLRALGLASAAFQLAFAAQTTVCLLYLTRDLRLAGGAVGLGLAATGPGAVLGSLCAARLPSWLPSRLGSGPALLAGATLADLALLGIPALQRGGSATATVTILLALQLGFGFCGQLVDVTTMTIRQAATPLALQGRAAATVSFLGLGCAPLGSLLGGLAAQSLGLREGLFAVTAGTFLSPLLLALSPLARFRPASVPCR